MISNYCGDSPYTHSSAVFTSPHINCHGTVLLTGANGSLAIPAVSYFLSKYPTCTAVLTVRDTTERDPNTTGLRQTIAAVPNALVSIRQPDLASLSAVHTFAAEMHQDVIEGRLPRIVAIICTACSWCINGGLHCSKDGFERSMAVNHIGYLALTLRLLEDMDKVRANRFPV
ncbi:hypothetical protein BCR34DRAFT_209318 [Clohesyomyces aquaticus]|uniref:Ketoreductase (KR) domain-containing protein n=1 Tax=Clohesyomyces aquaticus TaxID=1231657 RepID=A0A1Y2AB77_9PLEO|nr:hypothetical protein BCR34DRAFT_209318 [Clohesyomyces aquaticus]